MAGPRLDEVDWASVGTAIGVIIKASMVSKPAEPVRARERAVPPHAYPQAMEDLRRSIEAMDEVGLNAGVNQVELRRNDVIVMARDVLARYDEALGEQLGR